MRKTYFLLACLVPAAVGSLWGRHSLAAQAPPTNISGSFPVPANFVAPGDCAFDVNFSFSGKAGTITLPGGRFIFTGPALKATLTNLSNTTKSVTLNITGAFHQSFQNGNEVDVLTGRNLFIAPGVAGFVLSIGTFSFVLDANHQNVIQPLIGTGQLIDVCTLIS
jgi:hypothetical protein